MGGIFPFLLSFGRLGADESAESVSRNSLWLSGVPPREFNVRKIAYTGNILCKQDQCSPNKAKEDTTTFKVETTVTDLILIDSSRVIASHSRHYPTWKTICCFSLLHLCLMVDCYCSRLWIWRRCGLKLTLLGPISTRFQPASTIPKANRFSFPFPRLAQP